MSIKRLMLAIVFTFSVGIVAMQELKAEVTNYPNGVSSFGMTIIPGVGSEVYSGNVWFVDSGDPNGSDNPHEPGNRLEPFKTLDAAVSRSGVVSGSNNRDVIYMLSGDAETISGSGDSVGLDLDVEGLTIIGLGSGSDIPTITISGSTNTNDIDVDADNITLVNLLFVAGSATAAIDVNAAHFSMINCTTRDANFALGSDETNDAAPLNWIVADANADNLSLINHTHFGTGTTGGDVQDGQAVAIAPSTFIQLIGSDDSILKGGSFYGNFDHQIIEGTTTDSLRVKIYGTSDNPMFLWNENSIGVVASLTAGSTGNIGPNIYIRLADDAFNFISAIVATGSTWHAFRPIEIVNAGSEISTVTTLVPSIGTN